MTDWQPIETAPYQEIILVRNDLMDSPVMATRGYVNRSGAVCRNPAFCTSVFTPDALYPFPAGQLIHAKEWMPVPEPSKGATK